MFSSSRLSHRSMDIITTKHILHEQCQTIEQLKSIIEDLQIRHEKKEHELIKQIGILYNDLQQHKKKMAHLIFKYQQQKKFNDNMKALKDFSSQTDENNSSLICSNCSTHYNETETYLPQITKSEQNPKYYTLQKDDHIEYISAIPQPQSHHSLSSPSLSTTDQSSIKHNESSSSAYNTAESLPSSTYSDENESLERVLNAACTMYTTHDNLEHTIKLQEELFRQRLRLRGINLNNNDNNNNNNNNNDDDDDDNTSSEHFYDNIDSDTSDIEKQTTIYRNRTLPWYEKKQQPQQQQQRTVTFNLNNNEQQKHKVKFNDQYYPISKRKNLKSSSKINLSKLTNNKKYNYQHIILANKKLLSSNMLTVAIT
ncbi:unnamed protein product [Rotaria sp. Silwood1]|nr:unnamed protein product [Rotaria sp. Silwood1]CAF4716776.1 unnamed protein product [Rotaria sp. Silwood1]